jgi:GNAT superfamily N-acetyltransferase
MELKPPLPDTPIKVPQPTPSTSWQVTGPHVGLGAFVDDILRSLPDWFGIEAAIVNYVKEVDSLPVFMAADRDVLNAGEPLHLDDVFGFISIKEHFPRAAEIHLIAVREEFHRAGLGRMLLQSAEDWLRGRGVKFLQVKTLSPSRECEHYARTRQFYEAMGFVPLEEFPTLWGERNPCLMMVKELSASMP